MQQLNLQAHNLTQLIQIEILGNKKINPFFSSWIGHIITVPKQTTMNALIRGILVSSRCASLAHYQTRRSKDVPYCSRQKPQDKRKQTLLFISNYFLFDFSGIALSDYWRIVVSEKEKLLKQSHWFNGNLQTHRFDVLKEAAEDLLGEIYQYSKPKRELRSKHLPQLRILILNLVKAQKRNGFFTVSKSSGHYSFEEVVSFRVLVDGHLKNLTKMGFLKEHKGFNSPLITRRTRYQLLSPALAWLNKWKLDTKSFFSTADSQPIHLKDKEKKRVALPAELLAVTEKMSANVQKLNQRLKNTFVDLLLTDDELYEVEEDLSSSRDDEEYRPARVNFEQKFLHRVFNNGALDQGGRFYGGWWQTIPKEKRLYLSINNNFVEELDYSGMHVDLLYARQQATCPLEDPYVFGLLTAEYRDQTKIIFNRLLNAKNRSRFIQALEKDHDEGTLKLPRGILDFDNYIQLIEQAHHLIAGSFLTGASVKLQFIDSEIAESIMLRMLDEHSAVCLPIHDSFVVEAGKVQCLKQIMEETFLEFVGSQPQIKAVSRSLTAVQRQNRIDLIEEIFDESQGYTQRFHEFCRYYNQKYLIRGGDPFGDKPLSKLWAAVT